MSEISNLNNLEQDIKEIRDYLRDTRKKLETKEYKAKIIDEWKLIALVFDRTFFIIYFFITIITLFLMFPRDSMTKKAISRPNPITEAAAEALTETVTKTTLSILNATGISNLL